MRSWYDALKPKASRRVQILLAGALWTVVGAALAFSGARWIVGAGVTLLDGALLLFGVVLGVLKSRLVLDRAGAEIVDRIARRGEGRCLGGFLSLRTWGLVVMMIALGRTLRRLLPPDAAGVLYAAIGTGLLCSSRLAWQRWRDADAAAPRREADRRGLRS